MINPKTANRKFANFYKILLNSTVLKYFFLFCTNLKYCRAVYCFAESWYPQIANPHITNSQFEEGPQLQQTIPLCKFADLRFAELICGPPKQSQIPATASPPSLNHLLHLPPFSLHHAKDLLRLQPLPFPSSPLTISSLRPRHRRQDIHHIHRL